MKVLIIRRDNIGDLVCTTPLFTAIRRQFPDAYIAALVNTYNAPAISGNPDLSAVFSYTKGKHAKGESVLVAHWHRLRMLWRLRQMNFDYVILAQAGFARRALRLARFISPRNIVGFVTEKEVSRHIDFPVRQSNDSRLHETENMFRLLSPLGIEGPIPSLTLLADTNAKNQIAANLPPAVKFGQGPLIALHISARKEKQRWPIEKFAALAHLLHIKFNARFLVFWSPGDETNPFHPGDNGKAKKLLRMLEDLPVAPVATQEVSELIAGLSLSEMAILSDGGAMHLAAGLGKPLVCFFGNSSPHRWHPWGTPHIVIQKTTHNVEDISIDEAFSKACSMLDQIQHNTHRG